MATAIECFSAGIKALRENGWLKREQKEFADDVGYTTSHISLVFNGKRVPSAKLQELLAEEFKMHTETICKIGREIIEGKGFFPFFGKIEHLPNNSREQLEEIIRLTNNSHGIEGLLIGYKPPGYDEFLNGDLDPVSFFQMYNDEIINLINTIRKSHCI